MTRALAAVALPVVAAFALLPERPAGERLAMRAAGALAAREEVETRVVTASRSYASGCRVEEPYREVVLLPEGRERVLRGRTFDGGAPQDLAPAYLAGCPPLIARSLGRRLRRGDDVYAGEAVHGGRPVHELLVAPQVRLLVDGDTLEPVAVRVGERSTAEFRP